jgi:hypothetical protein
VIRASSSLVQMKRLVLILACLSIVYAGTVWALEGCLDIGIGHDLHHVGDNAIPSHHDTDAASRHSHSDSSRVHCPSVVCEFLISSRISLSPEKVQVYYASLGTETVGAFLSGLATSGVGDGPPGPIHSKIFPRHLLLSVIRI